MQKKLLLIGVYPEKGKVHAENVIACAPYGKDTLLSIQKAAGNNIKITVLAETNRKKSTYREQGITIKRMWKPNSFGSYISLLKEIFVNHKDTKNVLIEFEVLMFGKVYYLLPFPIFNAILRLMGKDITFVCHQVIKDIKDFEGHINIKKDSFKTKLLNLLISFFYKFTVLSVNKVIVFDEELKKSLATFNQEDKISVIPLAFKPIKSTIQREYARKKLSFKKNDFVILCFGYLAWYKGTDWIIEAFKKLKQTPAGKNAKLVLAGGEGVKTREKDFYKKYIANIKSECKKNKILLTGFIEEKDIPSYYQASDLVVLPYRLQMSASGPLSIAYSFKKPVMVSTRLAKIFETKDLNSIIRRRNVNPTDLTFKLSYADFVSKMVKLIKNQDELNDLQEISKEVSEVRTWEEIGRLHYEMIFDSQIKKDFSLRLSY